MISSQNLQPLGMGGRRVFRFAVNFWIIGPMDINGSYLTGLVQSVSSLGGPIINTKHKPFCKCVAER